MLVMVSGGLAQFRFSGAIDRVFLCLVVLCCGSGCNQPLLSCLNCDDDDSVHALHHTLGLAVLPVGSLSTTGRNLFTGGPAAVKPATTASLRQL